MSLPVESGAVQVLASGFALDGSRRFDPRIRESQIGDEDGRIRVPDPDGLPWRRICQLTFRNANRVREYGTGWFVGPRTIITAGHCVWHAGKKKVDRESGLMLNGKAGEMTIIPGRDGEDDTSEDRRFGILKASRFSAHPKWMKSRDVNFDIGCIHLDEDAHEDIGVFEFASTEDDSLKGVCVNVAGYPTFAPNLKLVKGTELYCHNDKLLAAAGSRLYYAADTWGGQSGGPVWVLPDAETPPVVVGVHAYGEKKAPSDVGEANSATRLTDGMVDLIDAWISSEGEEEAFVPAEVARAAGTVPAIPGTSEAETEAVESGRDASTALAIERLRHFANESDPGREARESGVLDPTLSHVTDAMQSALSQVERMTGRLLRRVRAQAKLDLFASILTLILSSTLFAAMQVDSGVSAAEMVVAVEAAKAATEGETVTAASWTWFGAAKVAIGLLTILSAILALVAKRMGGGEGSLLAKYTDLQTLAFDARMQLAMITTEGANDENVKKAVDTVTKLSSERHRLEASDFLLRDGGFGMWLLGVGEDGVEGTGKRG